MGPSLDKQRSGDWDVASQYVDVHCHCLPGLDDGPSTISEAVALCQALLDDGMSTVIATPHQLGRFDGLYSAVKIRHTVSDLNQTLSEQHIPLTVLSGAEVRLDERIPQLLESDKILTLADRGKYILLELPHIIFVDIDPLVKELVALKVTPIISHPERCDIMARRPEMVFRWVESFACLQVAAGSLLGCFGSKVETVAWGILKSGWVSLVATDAHNLDGRRPLMRETFRLISTRLNEDLARLVCIENPSRVAKGQDLLHASPSMQREVGR